MAGGRPFGQCYRAVFGPSVGINQDTVSAVRALPHQELRLVIEAAVADKEIFTCALDRGKQGFVVEHRRKSALENLLSWQSFKIGL
jgi:hypothetical protein